MMAGRQDTHQYLLMNKDVPVLSFICRRNLFDEPEFFETGRFEAPLPLGYKNPEQFLQQRKAPKHRAHIRELLVRYGCDDLEGFIRITHALSLNDTFWVKTEELSHAWKDVSIYRNDFDELVSHAAFDGTFSSTEMSSTSPEFGTDGQYAKCWIREGKEIFLYKTGSAVNEIEPFSEFFASQLSEVICNESVKYTLGHHRGRLVSKCPLFTSEEKGLAKMSQIFNHPVPVPELLSYFDSIGSGDSFRRMCVLDAIIFNPDRHYANFGVIFDTSTMQIFGMAPVFDNNRGLFPELSNEKLADPEWYISRCKPRIGTDFLITAKGLLTDAIRADLEGLEDFRFTQDERNLFPDDRLELLNQLVCRQIHRILEK